MVRSTECEGDRVGILYLQRAGPTACSHGVVGQGPPRNNCFMPRRGPRRSRHAHESRYPRLCQMHAAKSWRPAFAGMMETTPGDARKRFDYSTRTLSSLGDPATSIRFAAQLRGKTGEVNSSMTTSIEIPTLHTARLVLRAFRASDLDGLAAMNADPDVQHFLYAGRAPTSEECWSQMASAVGQWGLRGYGLFAVEADGRFAGRIGVLHPFEWPEPELAYALDAPFRGRGLATEAVSAVRDWAFARLGFARLVSFILATNTRSAGVAVRLGAVKEGTIELRGFVADRWVYRRPGAGVVV